MEPIHVGIGLTERQLVCLGEDQQKGYAVFAEPAAEIQIIFLRLMATVDQHKNTLQVFPDSEIPPDEFFPSRAIGLSGLRKAVPRQIHQIPRVVDQKMIDKLSFARGLRGLGQLAVARERVDER